MADEWPAGQLRAAYCHSSQHRVEIHASSHCGCFYCRKVFRPAEILEWIDTDEVTALCPRCGIDSVLGDASGLDVTDRGFLDAMHRFWFS